MDFERLRQLTDPDKALARFGPIPSTMRKVLAHSDLEALRKAGIGVIINIRPEKTTVHRVRCESTEVMSTSAHPKIFSETAQEAVKWLMNTPDSPWENCRVCGGAGGQATQI